MIVVRGVSSSADDLQINLFSGSYTIGLQFYCSWNIDVSPPPPFDRYYGTIASSFTSLIGGVVFTNNEYDIREITVFNPDTAPIPLAIQIYDGTNRYALFQCTLLPGFTLTYNATPGVDGSWVILDTNGRAC
jgi:hypothetical protein